jgi:hypothetical protein
MTKIRFNEYYQLFLITYDDVNYIFYDTSGREVKDYTFSENLFGTKHKYIPIFGYCSKLYFDAFVCFIDAKNNGRFTLNKIRKEADKFANFIGNLKINKLKIIEL